MSGPSDRHIDSIVLLDEVSWSCTHHSHKYDIKLSSLRAIYRYDLILHAVFSELGRNGVLLSVVRRYDKDTTFGEALFGHTWNLFVNLLALFLLIFFIFSALGIEIYGKLGK